MNEIPPFSYGVYDLGMAIDALSAYDSGCTDSGIHDQDMRQAVKDYLESLTDDQYRVAVGRIAAEKLDESSLWCGYSIEDVVSLHEWLEELLGS